MNQTYVVDLDTNVAHEGVHDRMIKIRSNETETILYIFMMLYEDQI